MTEKLSLAVDQADLIRNSIRNREWLFNDVLDFGGCGHLQLRQTITTYRPHPSLLRTYYPQSLPQLRLPNLDGLGRLMYAQMQILASKTEVTFSSLHHPSAISPPRLPAHHPNDYNTTSLRTCLAANNGSHHPPNPSSSTTTFGPA